MNESNYSFKVKTLEAGQRGPYQDSFYSFEVTSDRPEYEVKIFCMNVLKKSYLKEDMPDPFAGHLLEFKKITDNNRNKDFLEKNDAETYSYKVRTEYTG